MSFLSKVYYPKILTCSLQATGRHCHRLRISLSHHVAVWSVSNNTSTLNKNLNRPLMAYRLHTGQQVET